MKKLTATEILDIIEKAGLSVSSFAYGEFLELPEPEGFQYSDAVRLADEARTLATENLRNHPWYSLPYQERRDMEPPSDFIELQNIQSACVSPYELEKDELLNAYGLGKVIEVDQYGGEDCGSTWFSVKHFVDHDVYIRTDGHYQSYSGTEFYNGYGKEVTPQEKTITQYV